MTREISKHLLRRLARGWPIVVATIVTGPVAWALLAHPRNDASEWLVSERAGWTPVPVELPGVATRPGEVVRQVRLRQRGLEWWRRYPEIQVLVATYETRPALRGAELRIPDAPCAYRSEPGARLVNNRLLVLRREACPASAVPARGDETWHEFELVFRTGEDGRLALWTFQVPEGEAKSSLVVVDAAASPPGTRLAVRGRLARDLAGPTWSRARLLATMWEISSSPAWLWGALGGVFGLVAAGGFLIRRGAVDPRARGRTAVSAVGAVAVATGLAVAYAVVVPPLQAPDEPDHLLSFADLVRRPAMKTQTADWARRTHFERIKFYPDERFHRVHVGRPYAEAWGRHVFPEDVSSRSPTATWLWRLLAAGLGDRPPQATLLATRLVNALLFGLALGLGTALVAACSSVPYPGLVMLIFLLVPALPFFAMHMSETAVMTAAHVLGACAILTVWLGATRPFPAGLALGMAVALALASGRSAWPLAGLWGAALLGRALFVPSPADRRVSSAVRTAAAFWVGVALGLIPLVALADGRFFAQIVETTSRRLAGPLPAPQGALAHAATLPVVALVGACGLEAIVASLRARARLGEGVWAARVATAVASLGAVALVVVTLASLAVRFPTLEPFGEANPPALEHYIRDVLLVATTSWRVATPDHLLVTTFWTGFGWLDTIPPRAMVSGLVLATEASLLVSLVHLARSRAARQVGYLVVLVAGGLASLGAYAAASHALLRNLHGRYLIGLYVSGLALAWSPLLLSGDTGLASKQRLRDRGSDRIATGASGRAEPLRVPLVLIACALLHTYCLVFILRRYF